ncbi:LOW QUALITY PROTEIN: peroxiredoxin-like 2C [Aplochiton taeniatus]
MATDSTVTQQIKTKHWNIKKTPVDVRLEDIEDCLIYDRHGVSIPFRKVYEHGKSIIIFVRNFLCYTCKDYLDDLSRIPVHVLQDAGVRLVVIGQSAYHHIESVCSLTGYPYEIYVDPERSIYKKLGMRRGEESVESGKFCFEVLRFLCSLFVIETNKMCLLTLSACMCSAYQSPHVKSGVLVGHMRSIWRAMTCPAFDFQGDLLQQGGALIVGPGCDVHFAHFDMNRLDHMPINWLLQLAGIQDTLEFSDKPKIIHV